MQIRKIVFLAGLILIGLRWLSLKARQLFFWIIMVVIGLGVVLFLNFNNVTKVTIAQTLSNSLNVTVNLTEVNFNPLDGYFELHGFEIDNPQGFAEKFLRVQSFTIQVKPLTLFTDRIEIEKLNLQGISINIEQQLTRNNILEIFKSAEDHKQSSQSSSEKKFDLRSATIDQAAVKFNLSSMGFVLASSTAVLTRVDWKNINSENYQNLLISEVLTKIVGTVMNAALIKDSAIIPNQILDILKNANTLVKK